MYTVCMIDEIECVFCNQDLYETNGTAVPLYFSGVLVVSVLPWDQTPLLPLMEAGLRGIVTGRPVLGHVGEGFTSKPGNVATQSKYSIIIVTKREYITSNM